jgi:DNA-binding transcriptional regulator GbsR (MarR family)
MTARKETDPLEHAHLLVADEVGTLMEFWGFKRVLGRVWTSLYLADTPLTAAQIADRLSLSASAVSTALTELRRWGVVLEAVGLDPRENGRAQRYRAETDVWTMVSNVMRQRELPLLRRFEESLAVASDAMEGLPASTRVVHMRKALRNLKFLTSTARQMLQTLLDQGKVDAEKLRAFGG